MLTRMMGPKILTVPSLAKIRDFISHVDIFLGEELSLPLDDSYGATEATKHLAKL